MHLKPNINITDFFRAISKCDADVMLRTTQGDIINLNSELSKFIFAAMITNDGYLMDSSIECASEKDLAVLLPFLTA